MSPNTVTLFSYRTAQGCHVYGHITETEEGRKEYVTLSVTPPPVLVADRSRAGVDMGGREWRT